MAENGPVGQPKGESRGGRGKPLSSLVASLTSGAACGGQSNVLRLDVFLRTAQLQVRCVVWPKQETFNRYLFTLTVAEALWKKA